MKKIFGILFSLIGPLGVIASIALSLAIGLGFFLSGKPMDLEVFIATLVILCISSLVFKTIAKIGNKLDDSSQGTGYLRFKLLLVRIIGFLFRNKLIYFAVLLGCIALLFVGGFMILSGISDFGIPFIVFSIAFCIVYDSFDRLFGEKGYAKTHCKYCGKSLKGAAYSYEEIEREYSSRGVHSKIEFTFVCRHCGEENIRYDKWQTDKEAINKYVRHIIGKR